MILWTGLGWACSAPCLQGAVDAVAPGEALVVELGPGARSETLRVRGGRRITLRGAGAVFGGGSPGEEALLVVEDGELVLEDLTLAPTGTAGLLVLAEGRAILRELVVAPGAAGGVQVRGGSLEVEGGWFVGGVAARGAQLQVEGGQARVEGAVFVGAVATEAGGAVWAGGGATLTVHGGSFAGNHATRGGALALAGATGAVVGTRFEENTADGDGGAIAGWGEGELLLTDADLVGNRAARGGALHLEAPGQVQTVTFCQNQADEGGAVDVDAAAHLANVRFIENHGREGGALLARSAAVQVEHGSFLGNDAALGGAAMAGPAGARLHNSLVAWSTGAAAVRGVTADGIVWWQNADDISPGEAAPPVHQTRGVDPALRGYTPGSGCGSHADLHRPHGPLHQLVGTWPAVSPPPRCADPVADASWEIGAYGGPCGWGSVAWVDADEDGYPALFDCDDGDPEVNPGATEIWYDGQDRDCDGQDDHDQDGDGQRSADPAHGAFGPDCDDEDPAVHLGAVDTFNKDMNCDNVISGPPGTLVLEPRTACGGGGAAMLLLAPWWGRRRLGVTRGGRRSRARPHPE